MMGRTASRVDQVVTQIRSLIDERDLVGDRLPSEPDLARALQASRATVRQALGQLERDGLVVRRHGIGTFINARVQDIKTRLEEVWDFEEMIRASGCTASVRHVEITLGSADAQVADRLGLEPGDEVLSTSNVFLADGIPVIFCVDVLPARLVQHAYRDEELHGPIYHFLEQRCNQHIDYNIAEVMPYSADVRHADLLNCPRGSALHYFTEVGFNSDNMPILYSEEYYRPEYFKFKVVRKMVTHQRA